MAQVIVVGGGIAGLGAGYALQEAGVDVAVLEAEPEAGGRMRSKLWNGAWIDLGAEFITTNDTGFEKLAGELGILGDRIVYPGAKVGFHIWRDGKAHYISYTEPATFLRFGAMSGLGKAQLLTLLPPLMRQRRRNAGSEWEPWRAAWCDDQSIEAWLGRRAPEFLEYVVEPCYELYCGYEPAEFSRGYFAFLTTVYRSTGVYTFREGLGQLTRALAARLDVTTGARVTRVSAGAVPVTVEYVDDGQERRRTADFVLVAVPGTRVAGIVDGLDTPRRRFFERVRYTPHELPFFTLGSVPSDIPADVFFPRREDAEIAALGYDVSSTNRDVSFFRVSMKTSHIRRQLGRTDEEDLDAIVEEVARRYPGIVPCIEDRFVSRWSDALPIFWPGYLRALEQFVRLPPLEGVAFAGDYLAGPATGAAYATGLRAADEIMRRLPSAGV